jgi:hypothetical protein
MDMAGFNDSQLLSPEFGLPEFPHPRLQRIQLPDAQTVETRRNMNTPCIFTAMIYKNNGTIHVGWVCIMNPGVVWVEGLLFVRVL